MLLPYAEYKILQECYDKEEAKELAPLIEERMKNNDNKDDFISHEEMIENHRCKRAKSSQKKYLYKESIMPDAAILILVLLMESIGRCDTKKHSKDTFYTAYAITSRNTQRNT